MTNVGYNILILSVCWILAVGGGVYATFVKQPGELDRVQKAEQMIQMEQAEFMALLVEETESEQLAAEAVSRWNSRYRAIPARLSSAEVVDYLNRLTPSGFESFDVSYDRTTELADYSYHTYRINGRGYFNSLYRFVWEIENGRAFYRLRDLSLDHIDVLKKDADTDRERLQVMVSFTLNVEAYFGGVEGMDPGDVLLAGSDAALPAEAETIELPSDVLPARRAATNPFYPLIMDQLPPNTDNYVDVESASLVSIAGDVAVFQYNGEYRSVGVGDAVYLGYITELDQLGGKVHVRLNKGGIIDEVTLELDTAGRFMQARGANRLVPTE